MRSKKSGFLLSAALIFAVIFGLATQAASAVTYYVATDGDNSNSGAIDKPFQTIQKCAETAGSGDTCQIRKGTYRETVKPKSGIIITSYPDEKVTVNGSDPVTTEWTLYKGSIYSASYSASKELGSGETQVFVRDPLLPEEKQMMTEARWPNGDDLFHVNWATLKAGTTATQVVDSSLPAINNNLPNINIDWTGAKVHFWSGKDPWTAQTGAITAAQSGKLTVSLDGASDKENIIPMEGGYYYLFGTLAALDTQGEWVYDSSAGKLYFWAPAGADPKTLEVRVKTRKYAFDLSGRSNVTIRNINLFASAINTDASSTNNTIDGITAAYVSHYTTLPDTTTTNSLFDHLYDSGIILDGSGNVLKNSAISYSAGNGVVLIGSNNSAQNNLIHHVDYMANEPAGITVDGSGHKVQYNTIHDSGRYSITMSSLREAQPSNDDISYNNLYNAMMLSRDGAAVHAAFAAVTGNKIHHNWIHDTQSLYPGPGDNYVLAGVYLDEGAAGWQVEQNILWNNQNHNIFLHGYTLSTSEPQAQNNNSLSNNSIPDAGSNAGIRLADIQNCGSTKIVNNKVLVSISQGNDNLETYTPCDTNNNSTNNFAAQGATEMTSSVKVGCDFSGCSSDGPPIISGSSVAASIATQPYSVTVSAGQAATFSVTGAGSGTLSYQWQKNGVNLSGATGSTYKITATTSADNGAVFTAQVSNSLGSITSKDATLTVLQCAATVSSGLVVHIPVVTYSGSNYWADLQYNSADSTLSVSNAGIVSDASSYSNCTASSLSSDYKLHIPVIILNGLSYWADLQYSNSVFVITGYGQN